jgi:drug/metabolite transporter (DMT)-like permease
MLGEVLALAASLYWAVGANLYRSSMSAALALLIFVELLGKSGCFLLLDLNSTTYLIVASLVGWALGDTLYFAGSKQIGVSRAVPLAYSYPLFTLPFSVLVLNERPTMNVALGSFVIVAVIWLISRSVREDLYVTSQRSKLGLVSSISAALCWTTAVLMLKIMTAVFDLPCS